MFPSHSLAFSHTLNTNNANNYANNNVNNNVNNNINNNVNNLNPILKKKPKQNNISTKSNLETVEDNPSYQPFKKTVPFSQLLALMAKEKKNKLNSNANSNANTLSNNTINYNNQVINNFYLTTNSPNKKIISKSLSLNNSKDKKKSSIVNERLNTIVIKEKNDILFPTLNAIFNDNKVEAIKVKMKKTRQKEKKRRIFSLGKQIAKLFRNKNYAIILLDRNNGESIEIESNDNNNINSIKNTNTSQNKISLDNIPDISTDDEYSMNHFEYTDLSKEGVISFTLNAIYKNINIHTNMQYFQNKSYQKKVLNYITKLIENKTNISSSYNSRVNESSSFSDSFTSKNRINSLNSIQNSIKKSSFDHKEISSNILNLSENESKDKSIYESAKLFETKNRRMKNKNKINNLFNIGSPKLSMNLTNAKNTTINNRRINALDTIKKIKSKKPIFKRNSLNNQIKLTFKLEPNDFNEDGKDKNSINSNSMKNSEKKHLGDEKKNKKKKNNLLKKNNNMSNIKRLASTKLFKKSDILENKPNLKKKITKRKSVGLRNKLKLDNFGKDNDAEKNNNNIDYFAKEEKDGNECIII
jgi:hypothetical protein